MHRFLWLSNPLFYLPGITIQIKKKFPVSIKKRDIKQQVYVFVLKLLASEFL